MTEQNSQHLSPFVLLVEDNPAQQKLAIRALEMQSVDCRTVAVSNGREAWDFLTNTDDAALRPALILLDLNMPLMNGRTLLGRVKADAELKNIPVVMLTTSELDEDKLECELLGCDGYIVKPFGIREFVKELEFVCRKFLINEKVAVLQGREGVLSDG